MFVSSITIFMPMISLFFHPDLSRVTDFSSGYPVPGHLTKAYQTQLWLNLIVQSKWTQRGFSGSSVVNNLPENAGDMASVPGLGRSHILWSTSAMLCNYWPVPALQPGNHNGWSRRALEPVPCNKKTHRNEKHVLATTGEKPKQQGRPCWRMCNKFFQKKRDSNNI